MYGRPATPYEGADRTTGGLWRTLLRLTTLVIVLIGVVGAAVMLAPQALGLSTTKRLAVRGALARPQIKAPKIEVCPEGMALVDDRFCMDRYEASTVLIDEQGRVKGPHSPYEMVEDKRVRAESRAGVHPQAYISRNQAWAACQRAGKRLCADQEWLSACKGPEKWDYPYGPRHEDNRCNDCEKKGLWKHGALSPSTFKSFSGLNDPLMNQLYGLAKTGSYSGCVTKDGIYDLVGNLHEWTADPAGTFRGGYYRNARSQGPSCSYATDAHNANYHDYSTGFRCCTEPRRSATPP